MSERIVIERKLYKSSSSHAEERDVVLCPRVGSHVRVRRSGYESPSKLSREHLYCSGCPYLLVIRRDYVACRYKYLKAYENAEIDHFW